MVRTAVGEPAAYHSRFGMPPAPSVGCRGSYRGGVSTRRHTTPAPAALLALWTLTGLAGVVTVLGMLSIGIVVAPMAVALLVLSVVLTARRPGSWPSVAGLGFALAFGLAWFGVFLGRADPSEGSCSATADGVVTCLSDGRVVVPGSFESAAAAPWFVAAVILALLTLAAYVVASSRVRASGVGT